MTQAQSQARAESFAQEATKCDAQAKVCEENAARYRARGNEFFAGLEEQFAQVSRTRAAQLREQEAYWRAQFAHTAPQA